MASLWAALYFSFLCSLNHDSMVFFIKGTLQMDHHCPFTVCSKKQTIFLQYFAVIAGGCLGCKSVSFAFARFRAFVFALV